MIQVIPTIVAVAILAAMTTMIVAAIGGGLASHAEGESGRGENCQKMFAHFLFLSEIIAGLRDAIGTQ